MNMKIIYFLVMGIILHFLTACDGAEIVDRYYPNYSYLDASGEPGNWVPIFMPGSALKIRTRYKIDTGEMLLTFTIGSLKELSLNGYCKKNELSDIDLPADGFLDVDWWPSSLYQEAKHFDHVSRYDFYVCERQAFLALGVDKGSLQGYYWRIVY